MSLKVLVVRAVMMAIGLVWAVPVVFKLLLTAIRTGGKSFARVNRKGLFIT